MLGVIHEAIREHKVRIPEIVSELRLACLSRHRRVCFRGPMTHRSMVRSVLIAVEKSNLTGSLIDQFLNLPFPHWVDVSNYYHLVCIFIQGRGCILDFSSSFLSSPKFVCAQQNVNLWTSQHAVSNCMKLCEGGWNYGHFVTFRPSLHAVTVLLLLYHFTRKPCLFRMCDHMLFLSPVYSNHSK